MRKERGNGRENFKVCVRESDRVHEKESVWERKIRHESERKIMWIECYKAKREDGDELVTSPKNIFCTFFFADTTVSDFFSKVPTQCLLFTYGYFRSVFLSQINFLSCYILLYSLSPSLSDSFLLFSREKEPVFKVHRNSIHFHQ